MARLSNDIVYIVSEMDKVLEENTERHALPEQREMALKYRNIGIGIMGLADCLVKLGMKYGSKESIGFAKLVMKNIFRQAVFASVDNAEKLGNFPGYSVKVWDSSIIRNAFTEAEIDFLKLKGCLRNCSLLSIAPTGSIGTMLNISTGVEPFFALSYNRKTVSMKGETYKVDIKAVEEYRKITGNQGELPDYFVTAQDIPWKERIDMQAALQEFCDTAISSTVNLPKETTVDDVKELYKYAWKQGLKGVTIYREGSRDPILSIKEEKGESKASEGRTPALLRGEIIKPGDHWLGLKRTLITGCGTLHVEAFFDPDSGELRECYLSKGSTGGCNNFMIGLSRMMSLAARGGLSIDKIIDQLKSCGVCPSYAVRSATKKDTSKGSCCPVAVGNALMDMYKEIQEIICACNEGANAMLELGIDEAFAEAREKKLKLDPTNPWQGITITSDGTVIHDCVLRQGPDNVNPIKITYPPKPVKTSSSSLEECPQCHEKTLIRSGGCINCTACGWSKCN